MLETTVHGTAFFPPKLFFTLSSHPISVTVIEQMRTWLPQVSWDPARDDVEFRVFSSEEEIDAVFANGCTPTEAVVLFDVTRHLGGRFTYTAQGRDGVTPPVWSRGAQWGVLVGDLRNQGHPLNCAQQVLADMLGPKGFTVRMGKGQFPWGQGRRHEPPPKSVKLPELTHEIVSRLQMGPNMLEGAHGDFVQQLPEGSRISWLRVPGEAATFPLREMQRRLHAVAAMERASCAVLEEHPEARDLLMAGVQIPDERLVGCYLQPHGPQGPVREWCVRRPDMHVCGDHLVASENDEMPGGFTDLFHVDQAYDLHQEEWAAAITWLHQDGPLVFVVSDDWSAAYINSTRWLVEQFRARGFNTHLITTSELDRMEIRDDGVYLDSSQVGTLWRQFPIFEAEGMLAELVLAAQSGKVRMVPQFAHFGNKSWFALFYHFAETFRRHMSSGDFETLQELLPESHLVVPNRSGFPMKIGSGPTAFRVQSFQELRDLPQELRERLVLKITGANDLAARSLGVLVGAAQSEDTWHNWLRERLAQRQPFIVQVRFDTSVHTIAVHNIQTGLPEAFRCRVLLRPWAINGTLLSSHNCATPHWTTKIHGMVAMAVQPVLYV